MGYNKQKDAIFARRDEKEILFEKYHMNFLRFNKFGLPVFSKSGNLFVKAGNGENDFLPEKVWRYFFRKKI